MLSDSSIRVYFRRSVEYQALYNSVTNMQDALRMKKELTDAGYMCCIRVWRKDRWIVVDGWVT